MKYNNEQLKTEFDTKLNNFLYDDISKGSHKEVYWRCKKGHSWTARLMTRMMGRDCPYCTNRKVLAGFNDILTKYPLAVEYWDYTKNEFGPECYIFGSTKKAYWLCKNKHQSYSEIRIKLKRGFATCRECSYSESSLESKVFDVISKKYKGRIIRNSKPLLYDGKRREIDIFLPEIGVGFEVQDFATHSKTLDDDVCSCYGRSFYKKGPEYHLRKAKEAQNMGITLFEIWEDSIRNDSFSVIVEKALEKGLSRCDA